MQMTNIKILPQYGTKVAVIPVLSDSAALREASREQLAVLIALLSESTFSYFAVAEKSGATHEQIDDAVRYWQTAGVISVEEGKSEVYTYKDLTVDFTARIVTIEGKVVSLSPKEYDLLFYFVRNRNIALSREKLICDVWGYDFYGSDRTLDTHVKLLRKSIGKYSECVVTLRGMGYRFDAP